MVILYAYAHLAWFSTLLITVGVASSASKNYGVSAFRVTRTLHVLLRNVPCTRVGRLLLPGMMSTTTRAQDPSSDGTSGVGADAQEQLLSSSLPSTAFTCTSLSPQSISARFIFFRIFKNSRHPHSNTIVGSAVWAGIIAVTWVAAFFIAEAVPFSATC
jgi:hypothetical protein